MSQLTDEYNQRLLEKLRIALWIPDVDFSDEEIWKKMKGTFAEAGARVEIAREDLSECFAPLLNGVLAVMLWITRRMQR